MLLEIFDTGYFYADGGAMFGSTPKVLWEQQYPADDQNRCVLAMRSVLFKTDDGRVVLIDTGIGKKHLEQIASYGFFDCKDLKELLAERGVCPEEVTDVILTHMHFDHSGGCTEPDGKGGLQVSFPNARHWVSRKQWEYAQNPHPLEADSFFAEDLQEVEEQGLLRLMDGSFQLCPCLRVEVYDGHSPKQLVPIMRQTDREVVFAGDVLPLVASIKLEWISAYDTDILASYDSKKRLLEEAATQQQEIIFCHDATCTSAFVRKTTNSKRPFESMR